MDLGEFTLCLKVQNLEVSLDFYQKLGFRLIEDAREENWAVVRHNNLALSLYEGHLANNLINFRGGDVQEIAAAATENGLTFKESATKYPDGSWSAELLDPDGNVIFFNTFPAEREKYLKGEPLMDDRAQDG